ncbi:MAG: hypothetical protein ACP5JN_01415 [Candidatus Micrarchaeia archaeon]
MEEITAELLFEKIQSEKKTGELLPLPIDFYENANLTKEKMESSANFENKQYVENFKKLLNQLIEKRIQKVLIYLAYNKQLPYPVPKQEEEIYKKVKAIIAGEANIYSATKIKINLDVPEIITPKGKKIGPFSKGQIVEVEDNSDVEFILQNKIGEIL